MIRNWLIAGVAMILMILPAVTLLIVGNWEAVKGSALVALVIFGPPILLGAAVADARSENESASGWWVSAHLDIFKVE